MWSDNGKTWTYSDSTGDRFNNIGYGVAYGTSNGVSQLWVAVGDDHGGYGCILYSENGKTWTDSDSTGASFGAHGYGVAYGTYNGSPLWVAVGDNTGGVCAGNILYSSNGKKWYQSDEDGASFNIKGKGVAANHLLYGMLKDYYHP